ncbi:pseudouridine synthase [Paenibacillus senegalensis]|uniref:pseudouridine synthase n=1 Tax=Paenibacillus senegalensis TaxID=1465766 RepID=UPI00028960EB|nr:pseudouridine synthase [Paenibacillus senegalensis]
MTERLQKVLAQAGIASRRKCEEYITSGRVEVNEQVVTQLGVKVDPEQDEIKVDGRPIRLQSKLYLAFYKPKGVISSVKDPEGRKVVTDFVQQINQRVYPVGRLDYDTEGLLLLTNDGEFAQLLTHPKYHIPRTYHVTVKGVPHGDVLEKLKQGVELDDGMTAPAEVEYHDIDPDKNRTVLTMTIYEGRNRQVRRMLEAVKFPVVKLKRVQFGPIYLGGLSRGRYRELSQDEVKQLKAAAMESHNVQNTK